MKLRADSFLGNALVRFGFALLSVWARTIRFQIEDRGGLLREPESARFIGALWHNRLLLLPFVIRKFLPTRRGAALISASRDGEWLAKIVHCFGFDVVRGSSSRKGATAMLELAEILQGGADVVMTPDGPRGPVYTPGDGIVFLAQRTGARIVPLNLEYSGCWRLRSWDRFILPRPFARVRVILGQPLLVPPTDDEKGFARERDRFLAAMMALVEMR